MSLGGSNAGSPCSGRLGNTDLGHTAPRIPLLRPSPDRCHCTTMRARDAASCFDRQHLPSAKNGRKMGRVQQCHLAGLWGHRPQLAMDPAPPRAPAPALGRRGTAHVGGEWWLWGTFSSSSCKVGTVGASPGPGGCSHAGEHPQLLLASREGAWAFGGGHNDS